MSFNLQSFGLGAAVAATMMAPLAAYGSSRSTITEISFYRYCKQSRSGSLVADCEKESPDTKVDVRYKQSSSPYVQTLQHHLAGRKPPTTSTLEMDKRADAMLLGALLGADRDPSGKNFLNDIATSIFRFFQQDGKLYQVPVIAWFSR
ncbi:hypothetical protein [Bifidobacterium aquikefiri]|uniref:hypothetical protein n=1 Tax=Bifidobacterium aquikefiri TaxID=1653207 RepID=UPI0039E98493